ncbi:hypothetical protein [Saccharothrix sp. HUAS TT1]|uniref:hypothetical protein n=1 Tax=unclassified Saccharothrix TaxID=2593673 RepID=UPI00345BAC9F
MDWQITSDDRQETATAVVRPREGAPIMTGITLRHRQPVRSRPGRGRAARGPMLTVRTEVPTPKMPTVGPEPLPRSALTLEGLVHHNIGAIMAAATTAPPEELDDTHHQDHQWCQPHDAAP